MFNLGKRSEWSREDERTARVNGYGANIQGARQGGCYPVDLITKLRIHIM